MNHQQISRIGKSPFGGLRGLISRIKKSPFGGFRGFGLGLVMFIILYPSCKNSDSLYEEYLVPNGLYYPAKALDAVTRPGRERIEIAWRNGKDPKVVKARIFWSNYADSTEVSIPPGADTVRTIIKDLSEDTYSFFIHTYDAKGNSSVPVEVMGDVYGATYERSLPNRKLLGQYPAQGVSLIWNAAGAAETGVNLSYTNTGGTAVQKTIDKSETFTAVSDIDLSKPVSYQTVYKDSTVIDEFKAPLVELQGGTIPVYEQQITGRDASAVQQWFLLGADDGTCLSRGDVFESLANQGITQLFDGVTFTEGQYWHQGNDWGNLKFYIPGWTTDQWSATVYFTMDMTQKAMYKRIKMWMRSRWPDGSAPWVTEFELWGANELKPLIPEVVDADRIANLQYWTNWPDVSGTDAWKNDWVQLGDFSFKYPSGAVNAPVTSADQEYLRNGFDYAIDLDKIHLPFRYLRFECKKAIVNSLPPDDGTIRNWMIGQMQFFGLYADE